MTAALEALGPLQWEVRYRSASDRAGRIVAAYDTATEARTDARDRQGSQEFGWFVAVPSKP